jgi:hydrogenase maturation protease
VLIAGIGNVFQSDDAFGVEVAQRLAASSLPPGVRVEDFGIRGIHLAYELLEGYDGLVMVDAVPMGEAPGTLALIEPQPRGRGPAGMDAPALVDAHTMNPDVVLTTLSHLGGSVPAIFIIGCQPAHLGDGMGLTPAVAAAVDHAVRMCLQLVSEMVEPVTKGAFQ